MANIGILKELENNENRVALNHRSVEKIVLNTKSNVFVCSGAGVASDIEDEKYQAAGAKILGTNKEVIERSDIIVKVGKPSLKELHYFREGQVLFCFLNLITNPDYALELAKRKITAIGYESIYEESTDTYPILAPMSKLVGKMCYSIGSNLLSSNGSKGIFLGGSPNTKRSKVVIFGGGNAGQELMKMADSAGSRVVIFETDLDVSNKITTERPHIETMYPYPEDIKKEIKNADLVVGATFKGKRKVQRLLTEQLIKEMEPKSVFIDLTYECGGISETTAFDSKIKSYTKNKHGVIHYYMPNIASLISSTATSSLSTPVLKYLTTYLITLNNNIPNEILENAINVKNGEIANWIPIDQEQEDFEYKNTIKQLVENDDGEDLFSQLDELESNSFEKNIFDENGYDDSDEEESYEKTDEDYLFDIKFKNDEEDRKKEEKKEDDEDDPFGVNFDDIEI